MADINELGLTPEATPEVDWDAPESGQFPPRLYPGTYPFIFRLPEKQSDQFDTITVEGRKYLQVNWTAQVPVEAATGHTVDGVQPEEDLTIPYQRASFYKTERMPISFGADLMRSIGLRLSGPMTPQAVADALRSADGRTRGRGELGWDAYCKACDVRISTNARARRGEIPWTRNADGGYAVQVSCPKCGTKYYGREQFNRFKLPSSEYE